MALNTAIRGEQIKANEIDENHITTSVAGAGLTGGNGSALAINGQMGEALLDNAVDHFMFIDVGDSYAPKRESVAQLVANMAGLGLVASNGVLAFDVNELASEAVDVSEDLIVFEDATDGGTHKESIADFATGLAGSANSGIKATSGVLSMDINKLSTVAIEVGDSIAFADAGDTVTKKASITSLLTLVAGNGLAVSSQVMVLDLNELNTEATFDPNADFLTIVDATDSSSDKTLWSVIATAIAGSGLTATNGVLSADAVADNIVEADINLEDESANCDGIETAFTLSNTPVTNSVQVFLNGLIQQAGSGKDYTLAGTTVTFVTAPETNDILLIHYITND